MSSAAKHTALDLDGLGDLASLLDGPEQADGFKMYDIKHIHPDPNNGRRPGNKGFSPESIAEMAATILERHSQGKRGVMVPISLRPHPSIAGGFIINHGHRRYLGTIEAGLSEIPAYEDHDFDDFDQIVENLQREGLNGRETADFIGGKLAQGLTQAEIARKLGKSKAWVNMHAAMLDLPEPVAEAVANGQITDVTLAKELVVAHRENPNAVKELLSSPQQKPTRAAVKALRQSTDGKSKSKERSALHNPQPAEHSAAGMAGENASTSADESIQASESSGDAQQQFERRRMQREKEERDGSSPAQQNSAMDALQRLIEIALRDTGQSKRVADFLLSWWNATSCGGFDLTDLWSVDSEIADDMIAVIGLIRRSRAYPDTFGTRIYEQFRAILDRWRPELVAQ